MSGVVRSNAWVLTLALLVGACRSDPPPTIGLEPDVPALEVSGPAGCADLAVSAGALVDVSARLEAIGAMVTASRNGLCPPNDEQARLCRNLFLIGATDPIVGLGLGLGEAEVAALVDWHQWALTDGADAADLVGDVPAAQALRSILALDVGTAIVNGSSAIAEVATARAEPPIIEALVAAESAC